MFFYNARSRRWWMVRKIRPGNRVSTAKKRSRGKTLAGITIGGALFDHTPGQRGFWM
jgi:hypothetical protein